MQRQSVFHIDKIRSLSARRRHRSRSEVPPDPARRREEQQVRDAIGEKPLVVPPARRPSLQGYKLDTQAWLLLQGPRCWCKGGFSQMIAISRSPDAAPGVSVEPGQVGANPTTEGRERRWLNPSATQVLLVCLFGVHTHCNRLLAPS